MIRSGTERSAGCQPVTGGVSYRLTAGATVCGLLYMIGLIALAGVGCEAEIRARPAAVTIFAAASTADAVDQVANLYENERGVDVRRSFAGSSTLARQIESGAEADLLLSADSEWMDYLAKRKLIRPESRVDFLGNRLVLIASGGKPTVNLEPGARLGEAFEGRLSIGDPEHVPAGKYAREALQYLGLWDQVKDRLAPAQDVRAALQSVALGETEMGIVYETDVRAGSVRHDAATSKGLWIAGRFPASSHRPIVYPVALCRNAGEEARQFYEFLLSDRSRKLFEEHGFYVHHSREP